MQEESTHLTDPKEAEEIDAPINAINEQTALVTPNDVEITSPKKTNKKQLALNVLTSFQYLYQFIALGLIAQCLGWSQTQLQHQNGVGEDAMGWLITARSLGQAVVSFLSGFAFDFLNRFPDTFFSPGGHHLVAITLACEVGILFAVPFIKRYWLLLLIHIAMGAGMGLIDAGSNTMMPWIWKEKVNPWMLLMHFGFGLGLTISNSISTLFTSSEKTSPDALLKMRYAYWTHAAIVATAIPFLLILKSPRNPKRTKQEKYEKLEEEMTVSYSIREAGYWKRFISIEFWKKVFSKEFIIALIISFFLLLYVGSETAVNLKLGPTLDKKNFDSKTVRYIMTTNSICFTVGRVIGIPMTAFIRSSIVLVCSIIGVLGGAILMIVFPDKIPIIFVSAGIIGFSMSSIYPTAIALPNVEFDVVITGKLTSLMIVGGTIGNMTIPLLISFLMEYYPTQALAVVEASIYGAIFILLVVFLVIGKVKRTEERLKNLEASVSDLKMKLDAIDKQ